MKGGAGGGRPTHQSKVPIGAKNTNENGIWTLGQVTGGQSRVVKPKIAIFRLCSLRPNASKMGVECTQVIGADRVNNSEDNSEDMGPKIGHVASFALSDPLISCSRKSLSPKI